MKVSVALAGLLWPALAFGQQAYTNADLAKFDVPGAYTNQDLRRLPPLAVQREAVAKLPAFVMPAPDESLPYQRSYNAIKDTREMFARELAFELNRVEFSRSAFAGDGQSFAPRPGYGAKVAPLIRELEKRIALLDGQLEDVADQARRAGITIDKR